MPPISASAVQERAAREGRAEFRFERNANGQTTLMHQYCEYPHHIVRPLYLDPARPDLPTLCLQSVSGGLFGGDRLSVYLEVGEDASVRLATQAATKAHRSDEDRASSRVELSVGTGAYLEYVADPVILFPGARAATSTRVELAPGARVIVREAFLHHTPFEGPLQLFETYETELVVIGAEGEVLAVDRLQIGQPERRPELREVLRRFPAQGAVYVLDESLGEGAIAALRAAVPATGAWAGATTLPSSCGAYVRVLARDGHTLREMLNAAVASVSLAYEAR